MDNLSGSAKNWCGTKDNPAPKVQEEVKEIQKPKLDLSNIITELEAYYKYEPSNNISNVILDLESANKNYILTIN